MMSSNRKDYASPQAWLSALKKDDVWLAQLQLLSAGGDAESHRRVAERRLEKGFAAEYWEIFHQAEPVVNEIWTIEELSLPKLKLQTIGMLSLEWLEENAAQSETPSNVLDSEKANELLTSLVKAKMLDEKWQPQKLTSSEKALVAKEICLRLNINNVWQVFGQLWNIKPDTLRSYYNKALDLQKTSDFIDKIKRILR